MAAIDCQADLIVMATHGRTGINRALVGSVAGTVLRTAATPVVLIHPTEAQSSDTGIQEPVSQELGPVPTFDSRAVYERIPAAQQAWAKLPSTESSEWRVA
jgi:Universal stress protein family